MHCDSGVRVERLTGADKKMTRDESTQMTFFSKETERLFIYKTHE